MSWEQRNADFCKAQTDAQMAYIEAEREVVRLETENTELREQIERLTTILRNDCDIDASWDGLRRFWSIELTGSGCLMRDRACKAEAENTELRELVEDMWICISHGSAGWDCTGCRRDPDVVCIRGISEFSQRMRELGIEVK